MENQILIICGKSGAGKSVLAKLIEKKGYNPVVSLTSRPMREGEINGKDYRFVSEDYIKRLIAADRLFEYRKYETVDGVWYYGIEKDYIEQNKKYVSVVALDGLEDYRKRYKDRVKAVYIAVDEAERLRRTYSRGSCKKDEVERRLVTDNNDFTVEEVLRLCDGIAWNDNIDKCLEFIFKNI